MQALLSENTNELTHNWYITPAGKLDNTPMQPSPKILSQANRLRGDITSAKTLIQVCTGLDQESQRELQHYMLTRWMRWYFRVDEEQTFYSDIQYLVFDPDILRAWMAEWNRRELQQQGHFAQWYIGRFRNIKNNRFWSPQDLRKLLSIEASEYWEQMHAKLLFDPASPECKTFITSLDNIISKWNSRSQ